MGLRDNSLMSSANALAAAEAPMQALQDYFGNYERALREANKIHPRVVMRMEGPIRQALAAGYARSGLKKNSEQGGGALYAAAVTDARIETATAFSGIFISIGAGFSADVYKRAGAFEYGATRGLGAGKSKTKTSLGKLVRQGKKVEGVSYREPKPFFDIGSLNVDALYGSLFQEEVNNLLAKVNG